VSTDEAEGLKAEREFKRTRAKGEPIAKAILESFAKQFAKLAMHFAPGELTANPRADEVKYAHWAKQAVDAAKALIAYEEAKLAPIPHQAEVIEHQPMVAVNNAVITVNLEEMSNEELIRHYRSRIARGPALAIGAIEHAEPDAGIPAVPTGAPCDDSEEQEQQRPSAEKKVLRWPGWTPGAVAR
jgi:hypothetical protein